MAEFLGSERLTLAKLLTAQAMISDHMEGTWYKPYLEYLRVDEEQEKPASIVTVQEPVENTKRTFHCKERTVSFDERVAVPTAGVFHLPLPLLSSLMGIENSMDYVCSPGGQL